MGKLRLLLSSFGFAHSPYSKEVGYRHSVVEGPLGDVVFASNFYRMPPVHLGGFGPVFLPDYAALLLFDRFVVDSSTRERVASSRLYAEFSKLLDGLDQAGRLDTIDYMAVVRPYQDAINEAVDYDLEMLQKWLPAFEALLKSWSRFIKLAERYASRHYRRGITDHGSMENELRILFSDYRGLMLPSILALTRASLGRALRGDVTHSDKFYLRHVRNVARCYLHHVASTLCLSDVLGSPVHEWNDIEPLYMHKLKISLRRRPPESAHMESARQLISLTFPDLWFPDAMQFIEVLDDPRIETLRSLVADAVATGMELDNKFVAHTIADVVKGERLLKKKKAIYGWVTMPIEAIPWGGGPLKRGADALISRILEDRIRRNYSWVILISSHSDRVFRSQISL